ncbi:MAG: hypothetical protein ACKVP8_00635 [Nitrospiraceae bacterium]
MRAWLWGAWVLTIKDRWFYSHFGIDPVAVERAEPTIYCEVHGGDSGSGSGIVWILLGLAQPNGVSLGVTS